jgi:hypothetical protein
MEGLPSARQHSAGGNFGLGKPLVLEFTREFLPDAMGQVQNMFSHGGAYARFKDFLEHRGMLPQWYEYETRVQEEALRQWCGDRGIEIEG